MSTRKYKYYSNLVNKLEKQLQEATEARNSYLALHTPVGMVGASRHKIHQYLLTTQASVWEVSKELGMSYDSARERMRELFNLGYLAEVTKRKSIKNTTVTIWKAVPYGVFRL